MTAITGRRTAKLTAAEATAFSLGLPPSNSREELYDRLRKEGYNWNGKTKTWSQNNPWTGSAFEDAHGTATRHVKLRVMAHPEFVQEVSEVIQEALAEAGLIVAPTGDKVYQNRRGVGVRVYMEGSLR